MGSTIDTYVDTPQRARVKEPPDKWMSSTIDTYVGTP